MRNALTYLSPTSWKLLVFVPMAAALVPMVMGSTETSMHRRNELFILANLSVSVGIIAQGAYLVVAKKRTWLGLTIVIVGALVLGFGLYVLLSVLQV
jgi:hypothetical protein